MSCIKPLEYIIEYVENNSPSSSEQDILNTLRTGLNDGITAGTGVSICCYCNPDTNYPYTLASVETYLKYAEAVGITDGSSSSVFYDYTVTSGPVPQGALCQIINYVNGDDFNVFVDDTKPTTGVLNTNGFTFYSKNPFTWFQGSTILYTIGVTENVNISGCCVGVFSGIETYLKYVEAVGYLAGNGCCDFRKEIDKFSAVVNSDVIYSLLDKGVVEIGDTNLNYVFDYISGGSPTFIIDFLNILLDKGVALICQEDVTILITVEKYLKYAEAVGSTQESSEP